MSSRSKPVLDLRYRPPLWYAGLFLVVGLAMVGSAIYLVVDDPNGILQYIGILGVLGTLIGAGGTTMVLYPFVTPGRFRVFKNHFEYHHPFTLRLVQVPFRDLRNVEILLQSNSMAMVQFHRQGGRPRAVYPRWFDSQADWRKVLLELSRRVSN